MSFKSEFKSFIQNRVRNIASGFTFEVTNDDTRRFKDKTFNPSTTVGIVINYGNADRQRYGDFIFYNQSLQLIACVKVNDKDTITNALDSVFATLYEEDNLVTLTNIKASIKINPFTCDGVWRIVNGEPCVLLQAIGTISYTDSEIDYPDLDTVRINLSSTNETTLNGIISQTYDHNVSEDVQACLSTRYAVRSITNENYSLQVTFLVGNDDELHQQLTKMLKYSSSASLRQNVTIIHKNVGASDVSETFSTILKLNAPFQLGNFTVMTLTITR